MAVRREPLRRDPRLQGEALPVVDSPITPDPTIGSYLAVYWVLDDHHDEWNEWGVEQVNWLHANDRMFPDRDHIHTALYEYAGEANAPGSDTPVELALDRAYRASSVLIGEMADGVDGAQVADVARRTSPVRRTSRSSACRSPCATTGRATSPTPRPPTASW